MPSLMRNINIISRCAGIYRSDRLKETDLGSCHHSYILTVCREPGITQEQLSREIYINKSNVTRNLNYLEEHGYVERRPSETDKRAVLVYPTQKAIDVLPFIRDIIRGWSDYVFGSVTEEELEQLSQIINKIADRAKEYADGREL